MDAFAPDLSRSEGREFAELSPNQRLCPGNPTGKTFPRRGSNPARLVKGVSCVPKRAEDFRPTT
jgi:hypothetical protein